MAERRRKKNIARTRRKIKINYESLAKSIINNMSSKEVKSKEISKHIQNLTAVIVMLIELFMLFLNFSTLNQMKNERKQENTPLIILASDKDYYVVWPYTTTFTLNVCNIGYGVAKNIVIEVDDNDFTTWAEADSSINGPGIVFFYQQFNVFDTLFLLPKADNIYKLNLPEGFSYVYNDLAQNEYFDDIPDIHIHITYEDINNNKYSSNYIVNFQTYCNTCDENGKCVHITKIIINDDKSHD